MEHALHTDLRADLLPGPIRLDATGCLTAANYGELLRILDHAVALKGCPSITVNLVGLKHLEPSAWSALAYHLAALERERDIFGQEFLEVLPLISVHAPARPRHCTDPQAVRAYRRKWLDNLVELTPAASWAEESEPSRAR